MTRGDWKPGEQEFERGVVMCPECKWSGNSSLAFCHRNKAHSGEKSVRFIEVLV